MQPRTRSIVLVGFMGAGKTSVARTLAKLTGFRLVCVDELIAQRADKSISKIFDEGGESAFREVEASALQSLTPSDAQILDPGGGAVLQSSALLQKLGQIIWLQCSEESLWERIEGDRNRPLLDSENPRATFSRLFREREPLYRAIAEIVIATDGKTTDEIAAEIERSIS